MEEATEAFSPFFGHFVQSHFPIAITIESFEELAIGTTSFGTTGSPTRLLEVLAGERFLAESFKQRANAISHLFGDFFKCDFAVAVAIQPFENLALRTTPVDSQGVFACNGAVAGFHCC